MADTRERKWIWQLFGIFMVRLEYDLLHVPQCLRNVRSQYSMPIVEGTVENPFNNKKSLTIHRFLIDTGAAISVLNGKFGFLFKDNDTPILDTVNLHYGGGLVRNPLPVYRVRLKTKGTLLEFLAAFDKNMTLPSLLGHFTFLNDIDHLGISKKRKKLTLISK